MSGYQYCCYDKGLISHGVWVGEAHLVLLLPVQDEMVQTVPGADLDEAGALLDLHEVHVELSPQAGRVEVDVTCQAVKLHHLVITIFT